MRKMKKDERYTYIRKQAYELARSGKYVSWLSIEWSLINEGFIEANTILNNTETREEINQICKTAQSSTERENRRLFESWITEYLEPKIIEFNSEYSDVHLNKIEDGFLISSSFSELEIKKSFGTRQLTSTLHFDAENGRRYTIDSYYTTSNNFDDFTDEDVLSLIKIVISKRSF